MNRRTSAALTLAISVLAAFTAAAQAQQPTEHTSARAWLKRMDKALQAINYRGTFIYFHDNRLETMRIIHRSDKRGGVERLLSLNGTAREVIRKHRSVTCILPDSRSVIVEKRDVTDHPFPGSLTNTDTDVLQGNYNFKKAGEDRVAGHHCQIIAVEPEDQYRYGYRLWLDKQTSVPAKSDLVNAHGRTIEQVMFTRLEFPAHIPDSELKSSTDHKGYTWNIQGDRNTPHPDTMPKWHVTKLPPGFSLSLNGFQRVAGEHSPVRHMMFTDGLASVSVFAEPADPHQPQLRGMSRMGAVNAFGRVIDGHQITVVGEVPAATVRMIGKSIKQVH